MKITASNLKEFSKVEVPEALMKQASRREQRKK